MTTTVRLGTRGSTMALAQARHVARELESAHAGLAVRIVPVSTHGDRWTGSLATAGGKGVFTSEIDALLQAGDIDLAVHCLKDIPGDVALPEGVCVAAYLPRDDPRDALISREGLRLDQLARDAVVGTSAVRRQAQLLRARPDVRVKPIRGNVDSRIARLDAGDVDAIVVAACGLRRIGQEHRITQLLPAELMGPAVGAGTVVVATRTAGQAYSLVMALDDPDSRDAGLAERALLHRFGAGCNSAISGHATIERSTVTLRAAVYAPEGDRVLTTVVAGDRGAAPALGRQAADELLALGARKLLDPYVR